MSVCMNWVLQCMGWVLHEVGALHGLGWGGLG